MDDFCITIRDKDNSFGVPYFRNHVDMTHEILLQSPSTKEWPNLGGISSFLKILKIFKVDFDPEGWLREYLKKSTLDFNYKL